MVRQFTLAVLALAIVVSVADAGPIRNLVHRVFHPCGGRQAQAQACGSCSTQSQPAQAVQRPAAAASNCPGGVCPVPKR